MKQLLLNLFLLVTPFGCLLAQQSEQAQKYTEAIYKEISSKAAGTGLFSDTVSFVFKDKKLVVHRMSDKKKHWNKVRKLFDGTDYIVKELAPTTAIKQRRFELYNHGYSYILEVNNQEKISVVRDVTPKRPPGAPPATY